MEHRRFDALTQALVSGHPRRSFVGTVAGAVLAGLAGQLQEVGAGRRCRRGRERCGGTCRRPCPDVMTRNRRTCACECPSDMNKCGRVCVGADRCCPGEKECGGGCIADTDCCPLTHKECPDGTCLKKGAGACCPGIEVICPTEPAGCCHTFAGEECSDDGCCNTHVSGTAVCGGRCVDTATDRNHCGECGNGCGPCETCQDGRCRSVCGTERECCAGQCVPKGFCCGGVKACYPPYTQCCAGGSVAGHEVACCYPQPLDYCKVGPTGWATCSSNP